MRSRDSPKLLLIILAAAAARVLTLWVGRAEFTGWFNHTYYYFVQVRGLLEQGSLPYADMPLLFHLYTLVARALIGLGVESEVAIVASTRAIMILVPALIPVPIYGIIRNMNGVEPLRRGQWVLVLVAGFLPLSVSHLPESMQKNMLGLLLLSVLILCSQRLLRRFGAADLVATLLVMLLIVLSHYGTTGAMVLYGAAALLAVSIVTRTPKGALVAAALLTVGGALAVSLVRFLDAQRFRRIFLYLSDSLRSSLIGELFAPDGAREGVLASLAAVLALYLVFFALYWAYRRCGRGLPEGDRAFWLVNIIFCALLVLPVLDERLMARLAVFAGIPLLILLAHVEKYAIRKSWLRTASVAVVAALTSLMAVGELISSRIHNANHATVLSDIRKLEARQALGPDDLVITKTGAEHICNWFFGVKAGVITSLSLDDFTRYGNVYVMNPIEGDLNFEGLANRTADSEANRYLFMLRNIPRPADVEPILRTEHIEFFMLERPPEEWVFAVDGSWQGYSEGAIPDADAGEAG